MSKTIEDGIIKLELQSPWQTYYNKVRALLGNDTDLTISAMEKSGEYEYFFRVDSTNTEKINSLNTVFKTVIPMGNITLKIGFGVVDINDVAENDIKPTAEDFKIAFTDNPLVEDYHDIEAFGGHHVYIEFKKKVIQFYNDDITDFYGNFNGLAEDIAREVTNNVAGIFYCTSISSNK